MDPGLKNITAVVGSHVKKSLLCVLFVCTVLCVVEVLVVTEAYGQKSGALDEVYEQAGLDQKLGELIPTDLLFVDESGADVSIGSFLTGDKPVLLTLVYHSCPMLCNLLLDGVTTTLSEMSWTPGQEFELVTLSISPADTPQLAGEKKAQYLDKLGKPEAASGWHFLTGTESSIQQLADAIGFRYAYVAEIEQYVHPPILTVLTPEGKISQYLQGITFKARDIRLALVEASDGKVGSPIDLITLFCLQYDPETNGYVANAANLMKLGGFLTVIVLGLALYSLWRKEVHGSPAAS